jgi:hypothetical protein
MQSKVRKYLKKLMDQRLPERLPGYVPFKTRELPPGGFAYVSRGVAANYFIVIAAWAPRDEFTIDVRWSRDEAMPMSGGFWPNDQPRDRLFAPPGNVRIGQLMNTDDQWWVLASRIPWSEAMTDEEFLESLNPPFVPETRIEEAAKDALDVLVQCWEPLCKEFESRTHA